MKILVVGATGGLGRDVVTDSLARGHASAALVRDPARATLPSALELAVGVSWTGTPSAMRLRGAKR